MEKVINKVLVLGSTGMLGHVVTKYLKENTNYEVVNSVFRRKLDKTSIICDLTDKNSVKNLINDVKPDVVVNCVGVLIGGSNSNPSNAIYINSFLPHFLSGLCDEIDAKLIHVSTDCVFSGKKGSYKESDVRDAQDVYGRSKGLGEIESEQHLTLRTSIVGPEIKTNGEGLLHWFLNQTSEISGYTKAFWGGVTTYQLAKSIKLAIEKNIVGLVNVTNGNKISKYDMLSLFNDLLRDGSVPINSVEGKEVDKSLVSERTDIDFKVPSYDVMFKEMADQMFENKEKYEQYNLV